MRRLKSEQGSTLHQLINRPGVPDLIIKRMGVVGVGRPNSCTGRLVSKMSSSDLLVNFKLEVLETQQRGLSLIRPSNTHPPGLVRIVDGAAVHFGFGFEARTGRNLHQSPLDRVRLKVPMSSVSHDDVVVLHISLL